MVATCKFNTFKGIAKHHKKYIVKTTIFNKFMILQILGLRRMCKINFGADIK